MKKGDRFMNTLLMGGIQIGKEVVNVLDIGVISDGKTDCSGIINVFLNSKENANKKAISFEKIKNLITKKQ